jgi:hypothetical protein
MGLDLRLPIGMMFSLLGAMLALYGLFTGADQVMYASSLGTNVNLWWGLVLLIFGGGMLSFALMGRKKSKKSQA